MPEVRKGLLMGYQLVLQLPGGYHQTYYGVFSILYS
jgi:hypothetical protein